MAYLFDEDKSKIDFERALQPKLDALQTAFQNNVNLIYNKFVSQGTTPTAKTPAAISTAVDTLATAKYNAGTDAGKAAAEAVTWTWATTLERNSKLSTYYTNYGFSFDATNVVKIRIGSLTAGLASLENKVFISFAGSGSEIFVTSNTEYTPPNNTARIIIYFTSDAPESPLDVTFTYQAKILR